MGMGGGLLLHLCLCVRVRCVVWSGVCLRDMEETWKRPRERERGRLRRGFGLSLSLCVWVCVSAELPTPPFHRPSISPSIHRSSRSFCSDAGRKGHRRFQQGPLWMQPTIDGSTFASAPVPRPRLCLPPPPSTLLPALRLALPCPALPCPALPPESLVASQCLQSPSSPCCWLLPPSPMPLPPFSILHT